MAAWQAKQRARSAGRREEAAIFAGHAEGLRAAASLLNPALARRVGGSVLEARWRLVSEVAPSSARRRAGAGAGDQTCLASPPASPPATAIELLARVRYEDPPAPA